MILADTSALYRIAGIDGGKDFTVTQQKIKDFLKEKELAITPISIFEILNNKRHCTEYKTIIDKTINTCCKVHFVSNTYCDEFFNSNTLLTGLEEKEYKEQQHAKKEIGKMIVTVLSSIYANLIACTVSAYFIPLINFDDKNNSVMDELEFSNSIQRNYDMLYEKLDKYFQKQLSKLIDNFSFTEKKRNQLFDELLTKIICNYSGAINKAYESIGTGEFSFLDISNSMILSTKRTNVHADNKTKEEIQYKDNSLFSMFTKNIDNNEDLEAIKKYIVKVCDELSKPVPYLSEYMNHILKIYLNKILLENDVLSSNDFLDSLILDYMIFCNESKNVHFEGFITFDNGVVNKIKNLNIGIKVYSICDFS